MHFSVYWSCFYLIEEALLLQNVAAALSTQQDIVLWRAASPDLTQVGSGMCKNVIILNQTFFIFSLMAQCVTFKKGFIAMKWNKIKYIYIFLVT